MNSWSTHSTPQGPFSIVVNSDGMVIASGWTDSADELLSLVAADLTSTQLTKRDEVGAPSAALDSWLKGKHQALDDVAVLQHSGPFIERAWSELRKVAPGSVVSYTELADRAGRPAAARAAAQACARNPVALFVPCHRVVRSDGSLGGFRWGCKPSSQYWITKHPAEAQVAGPSVTRLAGW